VPVAVPGRAPQASSYVRSSEQAPYAK